MPTERTVQHTDGTVERTTTTDGGPVVAERRGGGLGTVAALILGLVVVGVVGYFLITMSQSEQVKSNAIAGAAESVSAAADNVGDAARSVAPPAN